ncbi:MAG TPA: hypothetical protein VFH77_06105, partial [Streptomyces sp.]|nr:hypothetical protein [Streptomyces sp.]
RDDLKGPAAALGPVVRLALLAGGALAVYGALRAAPVLLWPLTAVWCWRAWRSGKPADDEAPLPAHDDVECAAYRETFLRWLEETTRGAPGIHLSDLYSRLRERPALAHLDDPQLRAVLDHFGVPVKRTLRVGRISGRSGVRRSAIEGLIEELPGPLPAPAPHPSHGGVGSRADLRKSTPGSPSSHPSQKGFDAHGNDLDRHFDDAVQLTH